MDAEHFETLTRTLAAASSQRRAQVFALGGALGLLSLAQPDRATAGGKCKPTCGECQSCKKGTCKKTKHGKRCKRGRCKPLANGTVCAGGTCRNGSCTPLCADGIRNGSESDVDCGGGCPRCTNGKSCGGRGEKGWG